jgi:methionine synthase / methylenetetrahydrofolate reductase(NADPH)
MNGSELRNLLEQGPLLGDGGMGTSLVDLGVPVDACFEALNVRDPSAVEGVHRSFIEAGARVVWTNTFGANRFKLDRHGMADRADELARAGVRLARRGGVLVAGSVGPLGVRLAPYGRVGAEQAREAYAEQISALVEAGADLVAIETQTDLNEMEAALAASRAVAPEVAVLVTATFTQDDRTMLGSTPQTVAARLAELGADAIGVNCGQGPAQVLRVVRAMRPSAADVPLVARPNAGGPQSVGGRFLYPATPQYVAGAAAALFVEGARLLGGCCGTGPAHIEEIASALESPRAAGVFDPPREVAPAERPRGVSEAPASRLGEKLADGRFIVAVEIEPPRGFSAGRMVAAAETLAQAGADVIDVADSPMAKMRMSPWAACRLIQESSGAETVLHFPTRGRNLLRLQGDLLGVHALGIRNLFVCLGDPVTVGDYPHGTDNVDVTPTGLMSLITDAFNRGTDKAGSSIGEPTSFLVGCALSPGREDLDAEVRLLKRKIDAGAMFALTQPLYSIDSLLAFRRAYERRFGSLGLPILAGVLPLVNARHAEFIHNEVPGIRIPEHVLDRMREATGAGEGEGLSMAIDLAREFASHSAGVYIMPQFGRFDLAAEVVEAARRTADVARAVAR